MCCFGGPRWTEGILRAGLLEKGVWVSVGTAVRVQLDEVRWRHLHKDGGSKLRTQRSVICVEETAWKARRCVAAVRPSVGLPWQQSSEDDAHGDQWPAGLTRALWIGLGPLGAARQQGRRSGGLDLVRLVLVAAGARLTAGVLPHKGATLDGMSGVKARPDGRRSRA